MSLLIIFYCRLIELYSFFSNICSYIYNQVTTKGHNMTMHSNESVEFELSSILLTKQTPKYLTKYYKNTSVLFILRLTNVPAINISLKIKKTFKNTQN